MLDAPEFTRWRKDAASALRSAELQADADLHNWACLPPSRLHSWP